MKQYETEVYLEVTVSYTDDGEEAIIHGIKSGGMDITEVVDLDEQQAIIGEIIENED